MGHHDEGYPPQPHRLTLNAPRKGTFAYREMIGIRICLQSDSRFDAALLQSVLHRGGGYVIA